MNNDRLRINQDPIILFQLKHLMPPKSSVKWLLGDDTVRMVAARMDGKSRAYGEGLFKQKNGES